MVEKEPRELISGYFRKPRMYWGEPRYEGRILTIYPQRGVYAIGKDIFPLKHHSESYPHRGKPRMYFGKPHIQSVAGASEKSTTSGKGKS